MEYISTSDAPEAIGPYSQAVKHGGYIYCSGQIAAEKENIEEQTREVLKNLEKILKAGGSHLERVVKTTVYLSDIGNFQAMNSVYEEVFAKHKPARATVEVSKLPKDVLVEIDCIAAV